MFSRNNNSQTLWVGLSFLAVGLMLGLLFASGDISTLFGRSTVKEDDSGDADVDVDSLETVSVSLDDDAVLGSPDAPVTIVEFSDFQCPYCHSFFIESFGQIKENYIDTGKVNLVYRDFPLSGHPQANLAAQSAECVRKYSSDVAEAQDEAYYTMHDWLFANVSSWSGQEDAEELILAGVKDTFGEELSNNVKSCIDSAEMADEVNSDLTAGRSYGVGGTPTFFINGKKLVGAWPYSVFEKVIESQL